jgi:hypothetical protein
MNRTNYGRISGVVLDVCKDHGLWFDQDELRQVLAFIDGGGLEKSRIRQAQEETERARLAATGGAALAPDAWEQVQPGWHDGGLVSAFETLLERLRG